MEPTALETSNTPANTAAAVPALTESYELLDAGGGRLLERLGGHILTTRPCPPAWWRRRLPPAEWRRAVDARQAIKGAPLKLKLGPVRFQLPPGAGVRSLAPELGASWERIHALCLAFQQRHRLAPRVLHLYGGAGGSTYAAALAGAAVTHVDASAEAVQRARQHAVLNPQASRDLRWVVDDPIKFAQRERAQPSSLATARYDLIVVDPQTPPREQAAPSKGAPPRTAGAKPTRSGSVPGFDLERDLPPLLATLSGLLSDKACALLVFCRQGHISPTTLGHLLRQEFSVFGGSTNAEELLLTGAAATVPAVPCGAVGMWVRP